MHTNFITHRNATAIALTCSPLVHMQLVDHRWPELISETYMRSNRHAWVCFTVTSAEEEGADSAGTEVRSGAHICSWRTHLLELAVEWHRGDSFFRRMWGSRPEEDPAIKGIVGTAGGNRCPIEPQGLASTLLEEICPLVLELRWPREWRHLMSASLFTLRSLHRLPGTMDLELRLSSDFASHTSQEESVY